MSDGLKYNSITSSWLESQGFKVSPEDELSLEEGQEKPDFLCERNDTGFWVEVKSIDLPGWHQDQGLYYDKFKSREAKVRSPGRAFVKVAGKISEKDIKYALLIADRVLSQTDFPSDMGIRHYVIIPKDPMLKKNDSIKIEYETSEGKEVLHSVRSQSGKYSRNHLGQELKLGTKVSITCNKDNKETLSEGDVHKLGFSLGLFDDTNFRISIQLMKGKDTFRICSVGPAFYKNSSTIKTIRNSSSKAGDQFRSANVKLGEKPGVVVFHHDNLFASNDDRFISAFYGDLTYQWAGDENTDSLLYYGRNGFWNPTQNTTVSAAVYFKKEKPIIIYNRWAKHSLPHGLLDCKEYIPEENGSFTVNE